VTPASATNIQINEVSSSALLGADTGRGGVLVAAALVGSAGRWKRGACWARRRLCVRSVVAALEGCSGCELCSSCWVGAVEEDGADVLGAVAAPLFFFGAVAGPPAVGTSSTYA
jgi:hypothetical protein